MLNPMTSRSYSASWAFWSRWLQKHPYNGKPISIFTSTPDELYNSSGECALCQGAQIKELREPFQTTHYSGQKLFCACFLMEKRDVINGHVEYDCESEIQPCRLADLSEWDNPPGAGKETRQHKAYLSDFMYDLGRSVFIYGGFGSGKTHALRSIKSNLKGMALFVNAADLASKIYEATRLGTLSDLENELVTAPILLLDDFGAEHKTDYLYATIYRIVNQRWNQGNILPIILTSNYTKAEIQQSPQENLRRIATRIFDTSLTDALTFKQADFRGK